MTLSSDLVCFGEILWDILPSGKVLGGAPFNIVNRAHALGLKSYVISSVGEDELGSEILKLVEARGLATSFIQRHSNLPTGVVNIDVGEGGEPEYDILYPVAWDDIHFVETLKSCVEQSRAFVYSSLGLRDQRARDSLFQLLDYASLKICDINLRKGHYEEATIQKMVEKADILKANEHELAMVAEWNQLNHLELKEQIAALSQMYSFQCVLVTLGSKGAIAYKESEWFQQPVFPVTISDTVGAGDAFLASFIHQYLYGNDLQQCLKFACAVGALTASKAGGTPSIKRSEIEVLMQTS